MLRRVWSHEKKAICTAQANLSGAYEDAERHEEALRLKRAVYADTVAFSGADHVDTILHGRNLALSIRNNGLFAEALQLGRELQRKALRLLGDRHIQSILSTGFLADTLCLDPARTRRDMIEAEVLIADALTAARITLGPPHPLTRAFDGALERVRCQLARTRYPSSGTPRA